MPGEPFTIACDTVPYRKGFVEVACIHPLCVSLEAWDVSVDWQYPLRHRAEIPDDVLVGNTELELTIPQARALAGALLRAADDAEARSTCEPDEDPQRRGHD